MSALRFVVPMPPNVTNRSRGSTHWRRAHTEKTEYWEQLDWIASSAGSVTLRSAKSVDGFVCAVPLPPRAPFARVSLRSVMYLGGAMDDDNALARHKPLIDWLKTRGYLADDRKKNIVWEGLPEQVVLRDGNYRIELTLTPLSAPRVNEKGVG